MALPAARLRFPRDHGAHPDFRTEWWYLTGYANVGNVEAALGFQVTFFRSRVPATETLHSPLAAHHLVFAHAAITDVQGRKLWHDQRIARSSGMAPGKNVADAAAFATDDCAVVLKDWSLRANATGWLASVQGGDLALNLQFASRQAVLLQGDEGWSRKGPQPSQASYYYSVPQLQVTGELELRGRKVQAAAGSTAWLDHEWSQEMLAPQAVGWDWIGINLFDGSALTAFRLRDNAGAALWDGGSFRSGNQRFVFHVGEVEFKPQRRWRSPMSRAEYPVEWIVRTPADFYRVRALVDDQELDSRASTGAIYWEGLCEVFDSNGKVAGRGYLEMTGYAAPIAL
ncbi:MAG: carotenoid 1,2-hydratase [Burkholderiales bacterium]|nr:carotenoid 1,2-hydratase [Burkholderiales bacterium]